MLIARLIADTAQLETRLAAASDALATRGMPIAVARLLEHGGNVLQMSLPTGDADVLREAIERHLQPTAALIADHEPIVPQLFVSDMDSTIIEQECIDELADFAGLKDTIAEITDRAMRGEIAFEEALRERVAMLAGLEESVIATCLAENITPNPGASVLIATLKARGCKTVLVTGGFHHFADAIGDRLGFEQVVGNRLAVRDGMLTGELSGSIVDSATKRHVLKNEMEALGGGAVSLAAGDGANDVPMLEAADYGVAFYAKPAARAAANCWIDDGSLTDILKLLNISEHEWVAK
ncbi:MAG: phosphoserine phosphatase SerB [Pontixanthobacter sp.]